MPQGTQRLNDGVPLSALETGLGRSQWVCLPLNLLRSVANSWNTLSRKRGFLLPRAYRIGRPIGKFVHGGRRGHRLRGGPQRLSRPCRWEVHEPNGRVQLGRPVLDLAAGKKNFFFVCLLTESSSKVFSRNIAVMLSVAALFLS
jgi:hypothetical protein